MKTTFAFALFFLTAPAFAGAFVPPKGCETILTVQGRGCYVSNFYRCTADNPGDQWRSDFDQEGMFFISRIDSETQWVESYELNPTVRQTLDPNPEDPSSLTDLLATGRDSFAFALSKDTGERSNVVGFDRLTGKTVVIDGVTLRETEFAYTETDDEGNVLRKARGHEYVSEAQRSFYSGTSEWDQGDGTWLPFEGSPVQFINPGEPGFAATQPLYECDDVMSGLTLPASRLAGLIPVRQSN